MPRKLEVVDRHVVEITLTCGLDSAVDAFVGAAAAEMSCHGRGDRVARGRGGSVLLTPLIVEVNCFYDEPGSAEATLQAVVNEERFLYGVKVVTTELLDRLDLFAFQRTSWHAAGGCRFSIDHHSASAADARTADQFCSCQPNRVADGFDCCTGRIVFEGNRRSIDGCFGSRHDYMLASFARSAGNSEIVRMRISL